MMLRELARMAYLDRTSQRENELQARAITTLLNLLKMDVPVTVENLQWNGDPQTVQMAADSVTFQCRLAVKMTSNGEQGNRRVVYEEEIEQLFVRVANGSFVPVNDLADVGMALRSEPLPEIQLDPVDVALHERERAPLLGENSD